MNRRALLALPLLGCSKQAALSKLGAVPPFHLTDQSGAPFDSASLTGKPWVGNFMFTSCQATCPRQSTILQRLQKETSAQLVSFTVDVQRDTPSVLAAYAQRYQADPARWHFLTGPTETLNHLAYQVFQLGTVDGKLEHSSRVFLVDGRQVFRGTYSTAGDESIARLLTGIEQVIKDT